MASRYNPPLLPRGIRNHNPGNIEYRKSVKWRGQIGSDGRFIKFKAPEYGIRAIVRILRNYQLKYKLRTVAGIINRWAPPVENNTAVYIKTVANELNVGINDPIDINDFATARAITRAIITHENGKKYHDYYDDYTIDKGLGLAGIKITTRTDAARTLITSKRATAATVGATATVTGANIAIEQVNDALAQLNTIGVAATGLIAHLKDAKQFIWIVTAIAVVAFIGVIWTKYHDSRRQ